MPPGIVGMESGVSGVYSVPTMSVRYSHMDVTVDVDDDETMHSKYCHIISVDSSI